jgi:diguanylate cyclase (GGDEF)-like protein
MNKNNYKYLKNILSLENTFIFILCLAVIQGMLFDFTANLRQEFIVNNILFFFILVFINHRYMPLVAVLFSSISFLINGVTIETITQVIEIFFVSIIYIKFKRSILISDLIFWLTVGVPSSLLLVYLTQGKITIYSFYYIIITSIYRLSNILILDAAITYTPMLKKLGNTATSSIRISFSSILLHLCFASVVIPVSLFFIINNYSVKEDIKKSSHRELNAATTYVSENLKSWTKDNWINLYLNNPLQQFKMQDVLSSYDNGKNHTISFDILEGTNLLTSLKNNSTGGSLPFNWKNVGNSSELAQGFYLWTPGTKNTFIGSYRWLNSFYIYEIDVNGYTLSLSIPLSVYRDKLFSSAINLLKVLLILSVLIGCFALLLKKIVFNSIYKLANITRDLPEKLKNHEEIKLDVSKIYEINTLISNFQLMANNLSLMISNIESVNEKLQESQELLTKQANYDFLTNLPNRNYFHTYANKLISEFDNSRKHSSTDGIAFLSIDLDHFKQVNDTFGHASGDMLLQEVSKRMDDIIKGYSSSNGFIARLGGDEFVVVFLYNEIDLVLEISHLLQTKVNEPINIGNNEFQVGSSIGIGLYPKDGENLESILKSSDHSMYYAKEAGGNRVHKN